jgi:hypothetical protein
MEHADNCQCEQCNPTSVKQSNPFTFKKMGARPVEVNSEITPEIEITPVSNVMPPKSVKSIVELNDKVEFYYAELKKEIQQGQVKQRVKTGKKWYKSIGMWVMIVIVFGMMYGIYLYIMIQQGKHIALPFK